MILRPRLLLLVSTFLVTLFTLGAASPGAEAKPGLPVVVVAAERSRDHPGASPYRVAAGEGLILDVTEHRFPPLDRPEVPPNVVELYITGAGSYRTAWQESRRIELTAQTLAAGEDSDPYPGLKPGAKGAVTIGRFTPGKEPGHTSFEVYWMALLEVVDPR